MNQNAFNKPLLTVAQSTAPALIETIFFDRFALLSTQSTRQIVRLSRADRIRVEA